MNRKVIGLSIIAVMAAAIIFGTIGSVMEVIAAASSSAEPDYVPRLTSNQQEDAALAALRYVCPFH